MNDLTTKNKELATELERERTVSKKLKGELRKLLGEMEELQRKNKTSESEIRHLVAKVKDLENRLFPAGRTIFLLPIITQFSTLLLKHHPRVCRH